MEQADFQEQVKLQQQMKLIEETAKQYLTKEAISRFGNIKTVNPEMAMNVAALIIQLVQNGQLSGQITDEKFKELLKQIHNLTKKEFRFNVGR